MLEAQRLLQYGSAAFVILFRDHGDGVVEVDASAVTRPEIDPEMQTYLVALIAAIGKDVETRLAQFLKGVPNA